MDEKLKNDQKEIERIALELGFTKKRYPSDSFSFKDRTGVYIDLSACAPDPISILKTAVDQLTSSAEDHFYDAQERDWRSED